MVLFLDDGAAKLAYRIKGQYAGIGQKRIQQQINKDKDHTKLRPIFITKPPCNQ